MRLSPSEKLAKLEEKQSQARERILDQALQRLVAVWEVTPGEARERFREFISKGSGE